MRCHYCISASKRSLIYSDNYHCISHFHTVLPTGFAHLLSCLLDYEYDKEYAKSRSQSLSLSTNTSAKTSPSMLCQRLLMMLQKFVKYEKNHLFCKIWSDCGTWKEVGCSYLLSFISAHSFMNDVLYSIGSTLNETEVVPWLFQ